MACLLSGGPALSILLKINGNVQWCTCYGDSHVIVRIGGKIKVLPLAQFEVVKQHVKLV